MSTQKSGPLSHLPIPKAVLFDFDGVIADSHAAHRAAWRSAALAIWNKDPGPYPPEISGRAPREIARYFCNLQNDPDRTEEYLHTKLIHLLAQPDPPPLLPGVRETFNHLIEQDIPFGIASNAPRPFVVQTVNRHNLQVPIILGIENYTRPKPDPQPYIMLATKLGIDRNDFSQVWVFEDSLTGMTAAVASQMFPIGVRSAYSDEVLKSKGAKVTVGDLVSVSMAVSVG